MSKTDTKCLYRVKCCCAVYWWCAVLWIDLPTDNPVALRPLHPLGELARVNQLQPNELMRQPDELARFASPCFVNLRE